MRNGRDHSENLGTDGRLIKIDLLETGAYWIDLAHDMAKWLGLVNNSNEPSYIIACGDSVTSSGTINFSRTLLHAVSFIPGSPLDARSRAVVRSHI